MNYLHPINLGKIILTSNLIQAPLAGYSCAPFRVLAHRYGEPGFCATEMISAKDLIHRKNPPKRYLWRDPAEGTLCYQLSGTDPEMLARASAIVSAVGADIIDLNCGCPVAKIRAKNAGSKLLTTPEKIYQLVKSMKENTDAAVSIKIRIANAEQDHDDFAVIAAAESAGVDFITVHGRHWTERYDVACNIAAIAAIVKNAKVPIIANGDIEDAKSFKNIIDHTGCSGVMIARASVGRPWLFAEIKAVLSAEIFIKPSSEKIGAIFLEHLQRLAELENEKLAVLQARKLAKYYSRDFNWRTEFVKTLQQLASLNQIEKLIAKYYVA